MEPRPRKGAHSLGFMRWSSRGFCHCAQERWAFGVDKSSFVGRFAVFEVSIAVRKCVSWSLAITAQKLFVKKDNISKN